MKKNSLIFILLPLLMLSNCERNSIFTKNDLIKNINTGIISYNTELIINEYINIILDSNVCLDTKTWDITNFMNKYKVIDFNTTADWPGFRLTKDGFYIDRLQYDFANNEFYAYIQLRTCLYGSDYIYTFSLEKGNHFIIKAYILEQFRKKIAKNEELNGIDSVFDDNSLESILKNNLDIFQIFNYFENGINEENEMIKILIYIINLLK